MTTTIIIAALVGILGFLIGRNFQAKGEDWKSRFDESQKELNSVSKQYKKDKKKVHQLEQHNTSAQQKLEEVEAKYIPLNEDLTQQLQTAQAEIVTLKKETEKLSSDATYFNHQYEQIKKEKSRLNDKYAKDMKESKGWANQKGSLERDLENFKAKLATSKKENKELQRKIEAQLERMQEVNKFAQEFRNMKATNRKLTKDLDYWEKKHFDTHHELAKTVKEIEELKSTKDELVLRMKGGQIQQQNMMKKIEEFKTKFVNVNNAYHELKAEKNLN